MTERAYFSVEAMVRGYHAYKDIWTAVVGEELPCQRERAGNPPDPFAVAVLKDEAIVGHVCDRSWSDGSGQGALGGMEACPAAVGIDRAP